MTDFAALVDRYLAVWNEPDADLRTKAITELWAKDGAYTDPRSAVIGQDGFAGVVTQARDMFPGHRFQARGKVDGHHHLARFGWELLSAEGESIVVGFDVAVVASDGRIRAIHGFFDKVPAR